MGEFWSPSGSMETCKGMASAGHIYGRRIVGAEAFTAGDGEKWREHPAVIKALGDHAFCEGINRFVFHRYALQPWSPQRRPGMTMGPWGQHYERTETWWEQTPAWHEYLARCQLLLRQGFFAADLCYLQAQTPPHGFDEHPRRGYDWDQCDLAALTTRMSVADGRLVLPDGMSYRALVLPDTRAMTPGLLRRVKELVEQGATVIVGAPPTHSPSLKRLPQCDQEVQALASELWRGCDGELKEQRLGKGRVVRSAEPENVLQSSGVPPDFTSNAGLRFIHRNAGQTQIYFVANSSQDSVNASGTFRVNGLEPELWWPDSGRIERAPLWLATNGLTSVLLPLDPSGSVFVIFRTRAEDHDHPVSITRDGKPCLSALGPPAPPVIIKRAVYGILDDPTRTRDARQKVQNRLDHGESTFAVKLMAEGDDPAPNLEKTLQADYSIEGHDYSVKARDPGGVRISGEALNLTIDKAQYGVLDDPKRTRDVQAKLQALVDAGESSFRVARMAEGDDPAFLVVKTLKAEYTLNGQHYSVAGTDPDLIELKPKASPHYERALEVHCTGSRRWSIEAFQPGHYEVISAQGQRHPFDVPALAPLAEISGPWTVRFAPNGGAPPEAVFDQLQSWTTRSEPGIKYFSGTATYTRSFKLPAELRVGKKQLYLDLGRVCAIAQVRLNSHDLGCLWKPPFRVDITRIARVGANELEIKVVNLWPNRLIGDEQLPEDSDRNKDGTLKSWPQWLLDGQPSPSGRLTFTSWRLWKKDDRLLDSGLLGPVRLQAADTVSY
jgi:hypothetical protein